MDSLMSPAGLVKDLLCAVHLPVCPGYAPFPGRGAVIAGPSCFEQGEQGPHVTSSRKESQPCPQHQVGGFPNPGRGTSKYKRPEAGITWCR